MTQRMRRPMIVLAVLGATLAAVLFARPRSTTPAAARVAPSNSARARGAAAQEPPVADVKLELLKPGHEELEPPERNLFRFKPKAPPPPPPRVEAPPPVFVPPAPTGPPPPPPIPLKFIGVLETAGIGRVAILSDGRGNTFYGKEGQTVDGRYKVLKIGVESVEMSYTDGRGRQTLRLSGQ